MRHVAEENVQAATAVDARVMQELTDLRTKVAALDRSLAAIEFDIDGTIRHANDNFLQTMGYTLDEVRGRHHSMFVEPADAAGVEYKQFWTSLRAGAFQNAEFRRLGKGGRVIWIQGSYNPLVDTTGPVGCPFASGARCCVGTS